MAKVTTNLFNTFRSLLRFPIAEKILSARVRSGKPNGFFAKLVPNNYQYANNTYRTFSRDGIQLQVDISDYVGHYLYFGFPDEGLNELIQLASTARTILDIGANIGFTALSLQQNAPAGSRVIAFEPDNYNFQQLERNMKLNPQLDVACYPYGMGDTIATVKLVIDDPSNRGMNKIRNDVASDFQLIDIRTVDTFTSEHQIEKVELIKIDTEGFELNILKGAQQTLERDRPALFVELDDNNLRLQQQSAQELIQFLERYYSKIYQTDTKQLVTSKDNFTGCHFDIVALPD